MSETAPTAPSPSSLYGSLCTQMPFIPDELHWVIVQYTCTLRLYAESNLQVYHVVAPAPYEPWHQFDLSMPSANCLTRPSTWKFHCERHTRSPPPDLAVGPIDSYSHNRGEGVKPYMRIIKDSAALPMVLITRHRKQHTHRLWVWQTTWKPKLGLTKSIWRQLEQQPPAHQWGTATVHRDVLYAFSSDARSVYTWSTTTRLAMGAPLWTGVVVLANGTCITPFLPTNAVAVDDYVYVQGARQYEHLAADGGARYPDLVLLRFDTRHDHITWEQVPLPQDMAQEDARTSTWVMRGSGMLMMRDYAYNQTYIYDAVFQHWHALHFVCRHPLARPIKDIGRVVGGVH